MGFVSMLAAFSSGLVSAAPDGYSINSDSPTADADSLYRVDLANGNHTRIGKVTSFGQTRIDVEGLALAPDGTLYGVDDSATTLFPINTNTGQVIAAEEVSISGVPTNDSNDFGMTFACDGNLYISSVITQTLYRMDLEGEATPVGAVGNLGDNISAIAAYGIPVQLYGLGNGLNSSNGTASRALYEINLENGTASQVGTLGGQALDYHEAGLAFDEDGVLWAITDRRAVPGGPFPSQILQINTDSWQASAIASTQETGFESLSISVPRGCFTGSGELAHFNVNKRYMDRNDIQGATFTLSCNTGLPLVQTHTVEPRVPGIYEDLEMRFVVRDFESGTLDCELIEETAFGYTGSYDCDGESDCSAGPPSPLDDNFQGPCVFTDVEEGDDNICFIRNYVDAANFDVTKTWMDENEEFEGSTLAKMGWACVNARSAGNDLTIGTETGVLEFTESQETNGFQIYPNFDPDRPTVCTVTEDAMSLDSDVESDDSNCDSLEVPLGTDVGCEVINTRFYAGIPTLDYYGKILMALIFLSLGFFGIRRFV